MVSPPPMFTASDTLHFHELVARNCGLEQKPAASPWQDSPDGSLGPAEASSPAIARWVASHRQQTFSSPVLTRATEYLRGFRCLPSHPGYFRPGPKHQSPFEMRNPYTAAQALAYDFLEQTRTGEFAAFLASVRDAEHADLLDVWPLWASYYYSYDRTRPTYPCRQCARVFRQHHGLAYHTEKVHRAPREEPFLMYSPKKTVLQCPWPACSASFFSASSIRRHMTRKHKQGSSPAEFNLTYTVLRHSESH